MNHELQQRTAKPWSPARLRLRGVTCAGTSTSTGGQATGAFLFLADLIRRVNVQLAVDFVCIESNGAGTDSSGNPRITADLKVDVAGKHIVVVSGSMNRFYVVGVSFALIVWCCPIARIGCL
jgi:hypothetical protein